MAIIKSETDFQKMVEGKKLSPAEIAILRKDCGLPYYDENILKIHMSHATLEKRLRMKAWTSLGKK